MWIGFDRAGVVAESGDDWPVRLPSASTNATPLPRCSRIMQVAE
jgi:hypothetical protein